MNTKTTVISQAELDAQFACCDKIAAYWQTKGRTPTAYVETYGCQQNEADSEQHPGLSRPVRLRPSSAAPRARMWSSSTPAPSGSTPSSGFSAIVGALTHTKRRHPEQKIFLCGCMARRARGGRHASSTVLPPRGRRVLPPTICGSSRSCCWNVLTQRDKRHVLYGGRARLHRRGHPACAGIPSSRHGYPSCTAATTSAPTASSPMSVGRERSRQPEDILAECRALIDAGLQGHHPAGPERQLLWQGP